jgi:hypothetical protein
MPAAAAAAVVARVAGGLSLPDSFAKADSRTAAERNAADNMAEVSESTTVACRCVHAWGCHCLKASPELQEDLATKAEVSDAQQTRAQGEAPMLEAQVEDSMLPELRTLGKPSKKTCFRAFKAQHCLPQYFQQAAEALCTA